MKLSDHQWEFLKDVALLIEFANQHDYKLTGGELWRPKEMQKIYFDSSRSKTMNSQHLKKLAIDLNVFFDGRSLNRRDDWDQIKFLGDYWESLSDLNRWGGDFNKNDIKDGFIDSPHFERYI